MTPKVLACVLLAAVLGACGKSGDGNPAVVDKGIGSARPQTAQTVDPGLSRITVRNAYIPPQCYTRTRDRDAAGIETGPAHNPCYVCHAKGRAPNFLDDTALQLEYSLPGPALENPWTNLFVDRRARIAAIDDAQILAYVRQSNYFDADGGLLLADRLRALPAAWDSDGDRRWDGYIPDAWFDFDADGFDHAPDGRYTGWRAFGYTPFPGTFWPTNGSSDDVLIRLDAALRENAAGTFDPEVYRVNLAIVEAMIRRGDVAIDAVDERSLGVDLDRDGALGTAGRVAYDWAPTEGRDMSYVGRAARLQADGKLHLAAGLFPEGTEFLHSVRYLDVTDDGSIAMASRMKELRYARKARWSNYGVLEQLAQSENRERYTLANTLHTVNGDMERGLYMQGWRYQGFIEDRDGALRPQNKQETLFCMGCHGNLSATTDTVFAFPRKLDAATAKARGWYHWGPRGAAGLAEPKRADGRYEYTYYLQQNGAGDEFRANAEVRSRFFDEQGRVRPDAIEALHADIGTLILPSPERAVALDKAYRTIVEDQNFDRGRDALPVPARNVWREVEQNRPTGITEPVANPVPSAGG